MTLNGLWAGPLLVQTVNRTGFLDSGFTPYDTGRGVTADNTVRAVAVQSDGKIVVVGGFSSWNGTTVGSIVRLNSNGTIDTTFTTNTGTGADYFVYAVAVQSDGKIVVAGDFTSWAGTTVGSIVRLNSDGTRDTAFSTNVGTGGSGTVYGVAIQSDGKIVVVGGFSSWNGTTVGSIVRLNSNGTIDTTFTTNTGTGADYFVYAVAVQSDGKIVVAGDFTSWAGTTVGSIVRLNSDGTRDTAFSTNVGTGGSGTVYGVAIQSDGKIVVVGDFTSWNSTAGSWLLRCESTGARDTSVFVPEVAADSTVRSMAGQSDGKIVVGGAFTEWSNTAVGRVVRLNSDGLRETAFSTNVGTGANSQVRAVAVQSDGKIVVVGDFTSWNGTTVGRVVRLNSDGTRDTTFTTNNGTGANSRVFACAVQTDGKIVVVGDFTSWAGTTVGRIVRLNSDGTRDTAFTTNTGTGASNSVFACAVQTDGKILVAGFMPAWAGTTVGRIVRLNSNGTRDTAFSTNVGTGGDASILTIALQSDGKIMLGGDFSSWNGTARLYFLRLNSDGTRDTGFTTNASSTVSAIAVQSDGKIVLGGAFTTVPSGGTTVGRFAQLNSNGTIDTTFTTNNGTGANSSVFAVAVQSDGKVLVGGDFLSFNSTFRGRIARILTS